MSRFLSRISFPWLLTGIAAFIFFLCSSARHALFQSAAWDLGIFDQAVFLISQGQAPISSFLNFHILGDHAAWILYPLALLYKIYPDVHWLLAVQAIALASGVIPVWHLSRLAGLAESQANVLTFVYLLYPLVFNLNLFDFHPEVIALPALLAAILAARLKKTFEFCGAILLVLSCKAVLGLTVAAMGIWLLLFEKNRRCGTIALLAGCVWFGFATKVVIPYFGGVGATLDRHLNRYQQLGNSFPEISLNLLLNPWIIIQQIFTPDNLLYVFLLLIPLLWGLSLRFLAPLVAALPQMTINLLSDSITQKNLVHHYALPILPFLLVAVIAALSQKRTWIRSQRGILLYTLIAFLCLSKYGYFWSRYLNNLDTWQATRTAIAAVSSDRPVLTIASVAPHLTHRSIVKLASKGFDTATLPEFEYVLLNQRHPGATSDPALVTHLIEQLQQTPKFRLVHQQDDVYLFQRKL